MTKKKRRIRSLKPRQPRVLIICMVLVLVGLVLVVNAVLHYKDDIARDGRLITFHDRGVDHVILSHADTVEDALDDAGITVDPQDVVEPAIGSELLSTDSAVIIYRARPILVVDGSLRQKVLTAAAAPNEIMTAAGIDSLKSADKATFSDGNFVRDGASTILTIERGAVTPIKAAYKPLPNALTRSRGAQIFVDSSGVAHRETYYDLPMNVVIRACSDSDYTIRPEDGAKIDKDGYILVAASYRNYPKCSIVETSMGLGKVYDTGGFALRYPHGFDLATDWSNNNGR